MWRLLKPVPTGPRMRCRIACRGGALGQGLTQVGPNPRQGVVDEGHKPRIYTLWRWLGSTVREGGLIKPPSTSAFPFGRVGGRFLILL